jgi:hypothetical protein
MNDLNMKTIVALRTPVDSPELNQKNKHLTLGQARVQNLIARRADTRGELHVDRGTLRLLISLSIAQKPSALCAAVGASGLQALTNSKSAEVVKHCRLADRCCWLRMDSLDDLTSVRPLRRRGPTPAGSAMIERKASPCFAT